MALSFNTIPDALRVPLFYVEVDNSQANTGEGENQRTLIIGQRLSTGTAPANVPIICSWFDDAKTKAGVNSMLSLMVDKYRKADPFGEVWILPLADDGAAVAAAGSVKFTSAATEAGTFYLNIGDKLITMAVTSSQTAAQLATALAAAITAATDIPVTAAVDGVDTAKVNITARNGGAVYNDIPLVVAAGGALAGQVLPAGLATTVVDMTNGATNPSLTAGLAALADMPFDFIVMPYSDTTSLNALRDFLNDTAGRWSPYQQLYGHAFAPFKGTLSDATTLGLARNDQHMTIIPENGMITPSWLFVAAAAGVAAVSLKADPARPVQTLAVPDITPPPVSSRWTLQERNTLLFSGMSTFYVDAGGVVRLENLITTYQKNAFNQPDNSYLEIETMFQIMFLIRDLKTFITSRYPRMKLAASMDRVAPGSNTVTPALIRGSLIAYYQQLVDDGQAQDVEAFAAGLIVEQNSDNPNRLDVLYDPTIMNQLRIFATLFQFRQ